MCDKLVVEFVLPGIERAQIKKVYIPYDDENKDFDPIPRMKELIISTKEILWVKQVSLRQLASKKEGKLYTTLFENVEHGYLNIKQIRLILIDKESEQAQMRAFREYLIKHEVESKDADYSKYVSNPQEHHNSDLYIHTKESERILKDRMKDYLDANANKNPLWKFETKKYKSPPDAAILITDDAVLYEPLHSGDLRDLGHDLPILSGKMPVFEFSRIPGKNSIYDLIKNNFEIVFNNFSQPI